MYSLVYIIIFIFGLCVGSFLNVIIFRLGKKSILRGRSYCPHCKKTLTWLDLIPLLSFILTFGKCRYCGKKISWRYPLVELATAIGFCLAFFKISSLTTNFQFPVSTLWLYGFTALWLFYVSVLILVFMFDLKTSLIPNKIIFPAIVIAFLACFFHPYLYFLNLMAGSLFAGGFFLLVVLISKGRWMGMGDVKLALFLGLILGLPNVLVALFLSFISGGTIGLGLVLVNKKKWKDQLPFGTFLAAGGFVAFLVGEYLIRWYMSLLY